MRLVLLVLAAALTAPRAGAQYLTRPSIAWRTVRTAHFDLHFPAEAERWAMSVASRLESSADAVTRLVGNRPSRRVTVIVEDPSNVANGFALPFLEGPVIFLWPTPSSPSPAFGAYRESGELLAVHEYGHIAHLTRESRDPRERLFWRLMPVRIGPVARKAPAWLYEGYATLIEGAITGSGRPGSVGRAAIIRQWAREGRLPTYGALDATSPFYGGSMRYLVGSAFLEWLVERKGDESLPHLWRRMSARVDRSFDAAFIGVYGASPADLYGRFVAEVTASAMRVEREVADRGDVEGELVQHLRWSSGEPALSRDDSLIAIVLRAPDEPSRLVVWRTGVDARADSVRAAARARVLARDSLDVAPFDSFPAPRRAIATLLARNGRGHESPRFFADGVRVLVSRDEPRGDGTTRPDLFIWNRLTGSLVRVTHGASVRQGDPSPDGRSAAGVRCVGGICDLVRIDLATGTITRLAAGSPTVTWHRPRWSPDGRRLAASVHRGDGHWRVAIIEVGDGSVTELEAPTWVGPDDACDRYAPEWARDGHALIVVSERSGIANLARIDLASNEERALTRVVGSVMAPTVSAVSDDVYFLSLRATGFDVRRVSADCRLAPPIAWFDSTLAPVVPARMASTDPIEARAVAPPDEYGLGPRRWRILPGGAAGPDGAFVSIAAANTDPIGRLGVLAQGGWGSAGAWRGGSIGATLRRWPVHVEAGAFAIRQDPSRQWSGRVASRTLDARYDGASLALSFGRDWLSRRFDARAGASTGTLDLATPSTRSRRALVFGEMDGSSIWSRGKNHVSLSLGAHGSLGTTHDGSWERVLGRASFGFGIGALSLRTDALMGDVRSHPRTVFAPGSGNTVTDDPVPAYEDFAVGGSEPPFVDRALLAQRIALGGVPVGYAMGRRMQLIRVSAPRFLVQPSIVWVRAGDALHGPWQRVIGLERTFDIESLAFARLPGVSARGGLSYSLDEPFRKTLGAHLSIVYRP